MSTALIDDATLSQIRERLAASLVGPVELRLYRKAGDDRLALPAGVGCATCDITEELARELADAAPDKMKLTVIDTTTSGEGAIDVPTITIGIPGEKARIAFQGLPAGYEFAALLDAVERVSIGTPDLAPETLTELTALEKDVEVMVFVTPTCPYCPGAASMANRMAVASPRVRSVVVEASEFDTLSRQFDVQGVPRTVVNRTGSFVGALPERRFVYSVLQLAGAGTVGGELQ